MIQSLVLLGVWWRGEQAASIVKVLIELDIFWIIYAETGRIGPEWPWSRGQLWKIRWRTLDLLNQDLSRLANNEDRSRSEDAICSGTTLFANQCVWTSARNHHQVMGLVDSHWMCPVLFSCSRVKGSSCLKLYTLIHVSVLLTSGRILFCPISQGHIMELTFEGIWWFINTYFLLS